MFSEKSAISILRAKETQMKAAGFYGKLIHVASDPGKP
jgi:hypothetical protein